MSADNTQINAAGTAGDVIATEDMPLGGTRGDMGRLPLTDYKVPRSKIVVGDYGVDNGDVGRNNPLYVSTSNERQLLEFQYLQQIDVERYSLMTRGRERVGSIASERGRR